MDAEVLPYFAPGAKPHKSDELASLVGRVKVFDPLSVNHMLDIIVQCGPVAILEARTQELPLIDDLLGKKKNYSESKMT